MLKQIESTPMPKWLSNDDFNFNVKEILSDSLYYPCSGFDGDLVQYFMGNVYSFLYVDYGKTRKELHRELQTNGFGGYEIIYRQDLSKNDLTPNSWISNFEHLFSSHEKVKLKNLNQKDSFCEWMVFERKEDKIESYNPKRFSLIFLNADTVAAYKAIYISNNIAPNILAIIQDGSSFGGNWTSLTDPNEIFAKIVMSNNNGIPQYLINGGWGNPKYYEEQIWENYSIPVCRLDTDNSYLKLWQRNET